MALIFPFTRLLYSDFLIINGEQNHRPPAIDPIGRVAAKSIRLTSIFLCRFWNSNFRPSPWCGTMANMHRADSLTSLTSISAKPISGYILLSVEWDSAVSAVTVKVIQAAGLERADGL